MSTLTIRLPDEQHERLKALAEAQGISLNKLFEYFSTKALAEFDAETRFRLRAARGDKVGGLEILDRLDRHFGTDDSR
jgi:predicted transcriptional regulator